MKIAVLSLGCPRNTVDSEKIIFRLKNKGFQITKVEQAQALIINTCAFIEEAKKESLELIKQALELKQRGKLSKVIVWGCLVKRYPDLLVRHLKGVDAFAGIINIDTADRLSLTPPHISYLKIAEGCSNLCSYCAIPSIRGRLNSRQPQSVLKEVKSLDDKGISELNIVAQDITSWGRDLYRDKDLVWLLRRILKTARNIKWIRLLYTHPKFVTEALINLMSEQERICNYIDMPIQHINDRILKLMNRKITKREITGKIHLLRKKIPDIAIRTTLMAGFPTEKDKEFEELIDFIKEYKFRNLGAFIYSREENTPAFKLRQVPKKIRKERLDKLMTLQQGISFELNKSIVGEEIDVVIDEVHKDYSVGRAYFQAYDIDSETIIPKRLEAGRLQKVRITDALEYDLVAEVTD